MKMKGAHTYWLWLALHMALLWLLQFFSSTASGKTPPLPAPEENDSEAAEATLPATPSSSFTVRGWTNPRPWVHALNSSIDGLAYHVSFYHL